MVNRIVIQHQYKEPGKEHVEVWGEIEVDCPADLVMAWQLRLKSIYNILLTPDVEDFAAMKYVVNKGAKNNYASIYTWRISTAGRASGSVWLNFLAKGE